MLSLRPQCQRKFLSTPSARRATQGRSCRWFFCSISIHALREEGDGASMEMPARACRFLSTPSARRATGVNDLLGFLGRISIHALREEGDHVNQIW